MTEKEEFIRQICENPSDLSLRLIYADWLEENEQSQLAEIIRLQVTLIQTPKMAYNYMELMNRFNDMKRGMHLVTVSSVNVKPEKNSPLAEMVEKGVKS